MVINIHDAKTQFSRLVARAADGETIVISRAGTPVVALSAVGAPRTPPVRRVGFLEGQAEIPDDVDTMGDAEIARLFGAGE